MFIVKSNSLTYLQSPVTRQQEESLTSTRSLLVILMRKPPKVYPLTSSVKFGILIWTLQIETWVKQTKGARGPMIQFYREIIQPMIE